MERAGKLANPGRVFDEGKLLPIAGIGISRVEHWHVVLLDVVHHGVVLAVRREAGLVADAFDVVEMAFPHIGVGTDFFYRQVAGRAFRVVQHTDRLPGCPVDDDGRRNHPADQRRPTVAGMMDNGIQARQTPWVFAR